MQLPSSALSLGWHVAPVRAGTCYKPSTRRRPRSISVMRDLGSLPTGWSRSALSMVTRAVTLSTESLGRPLATAGRKTLRDRREAGARGDDRDQGGAELAVVVGVGLDHEDRTALGGPAALRLAEVGPADVSPAGVTIHRRWRPGMRGLRRPPRDRSRRGCWLVGRGMPMEDRKGPAVKARPRCAARPLPRSSRRWQAAAPPCSVRRSAAGWRAAAARSAPAAPVPGSPPRLPGR